MNQGIFGNTDFTLSIMDIYNADIYNLPGAGQSVVCFEGGSSEKNQTLNLINCRVKCLSDASTGGQYSSAVGCGTVIGSNGRLNLYNTVLYSQNGNSIVVMSGNTLTVKHYGTTLTNVAQNAIGTITTSLGSLTINAAVAPEF